VSGHEHTIGVAITVPEPYGCLLQDWRRRFGDPLADAIPTHVTLLPPTQVATDSMAGVEDHLDDVAAAERGFEMHLRGTGTFRPVSPVVFVALALGIGDCERIEERVRAGPLARKLPFPYHPHVTVAHDLPDAVLDGAYRDLADYEAQFPVECFHLYEHGLDGVWRPRKEYALGEPRQQPTPAA
jgi:2'-5' RNA ligase